MTTSTNSADIGSKSVDGIEQRARELLAVEFERYGLPMEGGWARDGSGTDSPYIRAIIAALRSAEQPSNPSVSPNSSQQTSEPEPVAWMLRDSRTGEVYWDAELCVWRCASSANDCAEDMNENLDDASFEVFPLYATPSAPQQREVANPNLCPACKTWPVDGDECPNCGTKKPFDRSCREWDRLHNTYRREDMRAALESFRSRLAGENAS